MSKAAVAEAENSETPVLAKPNIFKRFWQLITRNVPLILSFLLPVLVMILVFIQRGIFPFGERCFLRTDLYHQYAPFFQELSDKIKHGGSLFYSWDIGNGSNFLALFAYYLSSPLNIFLLISPTNRVIEFITYGIVLKIGLSGFTMGYYLKKHTGKNDYSITLFSIFYALSGYMAAYSWNIMWLDCLVAFPLVILGLERLVKEDKCMLYCLSLAFCIITNYYIAIMICIAVVFYFLMLILTTPHKKEAVFIDEATGRPFTRTYYMNYPKKVGMFALYSLIAGGLSAILLIPAYYALQMSASASSTFPTTFTSYFSILEMLQRHLDNVDVHLGLDHWPNIFCGVAIFIFIPLYIMNKKVNWKEKVGYLLLILFFLASFSMNFLNFIWHGFHYPNSLPARQSFIYVFLLLVMCYKGFLGLKDRSVSQLVGSISGSVILVLFMEQMFATDKSWNFKIYYVSILFLALYGILLYLYRKKKGHIAILTVVAMLGVFGENFMNTTITSVTTVNRNDYTKYDDDYTALYSTAKDLSDRLFFRCEKLKLRTKNDGSWYQYPSMSVFSSTANASMSSYYKIWGMESATNAYSKTGATILVDMLFSVKYELSNITYPDNELRRLVASSGDVKMYENKYSLPLGFMVPSDIETAWYSGGSNPIDTQNLFINAAANVGSVFKYVTFTDADPSESVAELTVEEDGYYYAYLLNSSIDEATTLVKSNTGHSDQSVTHTSLKRRFILDIGYAYKGDTITVTSKTEDQSLFLSLYVVDPEKMKEAYNKLNEQSFDVTTWKDSLIEGTIDVKDAGLMYTSIAYENGWNVYVDDVKVDAVKLKDTMMAIPLGAGKHNIRLEYVPEGFFPGLKLTLIALGALILLTLFRYLYRRFVHSLGAFVEDEYMDEEEAFDYLDSHNDVKTDHFNGYDEDDDEDEDEEPEKEEASKSKETKKSDKADEKPATDTPAENKSSSDEAVATEAEGENKEETPAEEEKKEDKKIKLLWR